MLTDRFLRSLAPAPKGKRVWHWNSRVSGFGVAVADLEDPDPARRGKAGKITFVLYARFQADASPTRRPIGTYGAISLEEARDIAGQWRSLVDKGIDPAAIARAQRETEAKEAALRIKHSFANVAEAFISQKMAHERRGKKAEPTFRAVFVKAWANRPISEITTGDVLEIIDAKKRNAPSMARALLGLIKRFFNWAIDQQNYAID